MRTALLLIAVLLSQFALAQETLRIHGSNTIGAHLAPELIESWLASRGWRDTQRTVIATDELLFKANKANGEFITVELKAHGTGTGIENLIAGACDVAMASRNVSAEERDRYFQRMGFDLARSEHVIALDGVAVVVNKSNPLASIDLPTLRAIFTGKLSNWRSLNGTNAPIRVLARDAKSGTFDAFKSAVLLDAAIAPTASRFDANHIIDAEVAGDPNAIGFLSLSEANASKTLSINGGGVAAVAPTLANIAIEDYPLSRRLLLYTQANDGPLAEDFAGYAVSLQAQATIDKVGFVSLAVRALDVPLSAGAPEEYREFVQGAKRLSVNFRFNDSAVILDSRAQMDIFRLSAFLKLKGQNGVLRLAGFTDDQLKKPYLADSMSETWAELVANGLGNSSVRVTALRGFGSRLRVADNNSARGRELNRRVEVWWVPAN